jgi:hypothetical protein
LPQLNRAIAELLVELNGKPFQKLPGRHKSLFESINRPALKPLPAQAYQFAEVKKPPSTLTIISRLAAIITVCHTLIKKKIDVPLTATTLECLYKGKRVASHIRSAHKGCHSKIKEHMPKSHQ